MKELKRVGVGVSRRRRERKYVIVGNVLGLREMEKGGE